MFWKKKKETEKGDVSWKLLSRATAIIMTVVYAVYVSNVVYNFIPYDSWWLDFINNCVYYGPIVICALAAMAAFSNKSFIIRMVILAIWILIFLFSFFPDVFYNIIH